MKYQKKLVGENVYLSPMSADDCEKYAEWFNKSDVTDGLGVSYFQNNAVSERDWIEKQLHEQTHQYAVVSLENDALIGNIGLENINDIHRSCKIGLFIGDEENRGRGYGTEALRLLCRYCFDVLNMHSLELNVYSFNKRAVASYKKVGFVETGVRRDGYFLGGRYYDIIIMDLLRGELR